MTTPEHSPSAGEMSEPPHECLRDASFCIAVTGEGAYAEVVHGGWQAMLAGFARTMWTDGDTSNHPEEWAEWLEELSDRDEWLHDESNEPSSFSAELGETANVSVYRLARAALPAAAPAAQPIDLKLLADCDVLIRDLEKVIAKCRPGYMVSKLAEWLTDALAIATAIRASIGASSAAQPDARDAARYRALRANTGNETDLSSGPGSSKELTIRINVAGCERWTEAGAPDFPATLDAALDDEVRIHRAMEQPSASSAAQPVATRNCDRPDCSAGGDGPCTQCEGRF